MTWVNFQTIEIAAKKVEKTNLLSFGTSLCWSSILSRVQIIESNHESNLVLVNDNWLETIESFIKSN